MGVKYNTFVRFYSICPFPFLSFFILAIAYSLNAWTDFNGWWLKRRGLSQGSALQASVFRNFHFLWVIFLKNLQNFAASAEIPAKAKMLNNFLLA
jgi:hypothetical protein